MEHKILHQPHPLLQVKLPSHTSIYAVGGSLHSFDGDIQLKTIIRQKNWIDYLSILTSRKHLTTNIFTANSPASINFVAQALHSIHAEELATTNLYFSPLNILAWYGNLYFQSVVNQNKMLAFLADELTLTNINGNGTLFFTACGNLIEKNLTQETIYINNGFLVGFEHGVNCTPHTIGNLTKTLLSEEGILLRLEGTGRVWLQTRNPNLLS
jgi:uncharacterized protein (AIM24 family)